MKNLKFEHNPKCYSDYAKWYDGAMDENHFSLLKDFGGCFVYNKDFKDKRITNSFINSLCRQLKEEEYIYNAYLSCNENETIEVYLSYKGFSYFDNKRTKMFWRLFPIIISLIALIKSFQQELVLLIQLIMKSTK